MTLSLRWRVIPPPITLRWRGPDLSPAGLPQVPQPSAVATLIGPPGQGTGVETAITAVADQNLSAGFPVAISRATGRMILADADYKPSAFVVGLLTSAVASGFVGQASPVRVTLDDWTAATGAPALLQGQAYFLKSGGGLTTAPPGVGSCVVLVGIAVSSATLQLDVQPPIQL